MLDVQEKLGLEESEIGNVPPYPEADMMMKMTVRCALYFH